jgi:hypothetical protein
MRTGIIALVVTIHSSYAAPGLCQEPQPSAPVMSALRFFDALAAMDPDSSLRALRTVPVSPEARELARATLPPEGALRPTPDEVKKLAALTPVLIYHERQQVFDTKVIDLPQAYMGLHARTILLISRPALRVLTASDLQAVGAHEVAHDFFSGEFEQAAHGSARQQLELQCDGIAALTLVSAAVSTTAGQKPAAHREPPAASRLPHRSVTREGRTSAKNLTELAIATTREAPPVQRPSRQAASPT